MTVTGNTILDIGSPRYPRIVCRPVQRRLGAIQDLIGRGLSALGLRQIGGSGLNLALIHSCGNGAHRAALRDSITRARLGFVQPVNDELRGLSGNSGKSGAGALTIGAVAAEARGNI